MVLECLIQMTVIFLPNTVNQAQNPVNLTIAMAVFAVLLFVHEASTVIITTVCLPM